MKKKKIENLPITIPMEIEKYIVGAKLYDTSCHSGAQVLFIDKDEEEAFKQKMSVKFPLDQFVDVEPSTNPLARFAPSDLL